MESLEKLLERAEAEANALDAATVAKEGHETEARSLSVEVMNLRKQLEEKTALCNRLEIVLKQLMTTKERKHETCSSASTTAFDLSNAHFMSVLAQWKNQLWFRP